jgi:glycosyltransferase involved in cell wall biosynthesis
LKTVKYKHSGIAKKGKRLSSHFVPPDLSAYDIVNVNPKLERPANCPAVTVLICALNEEESIPFVLPKIPNWVDEILLVDGHSSDGSVALAKHLCPKLRVLFQPKTGKGDALKFGVGQAKGEIIVTLDADGETPPEEIESFIQPLLDGNDFAKGSRLFKTRPHKMPPYRWFGNKILAFTCNILYGTRFSDICSGYNSFWKKAYLELDLTYAESEIGCSMEQQMIVKAKKAGMRIKEVPHTSRGRIGGTSVLKNVKLSVNQGFRDWFVIIRERFRG